MKTVLTTNAYVSRSPLSQALVHEGMLYCSGQAPVDPSTGLVSADVKEQTHQVLKNIQAVLEEGGSSFAKVIRTTVYLVDVADGAAVNEVYSQYFPGPLPTRTMIGVKALANTKWRVEIDAIAHLAED